MLRIPPLIPIVHKLRMLLRKSSSPNAVNCSNSSHSTMAEGVAWNILGDVFIAHYGEALFKSLLFPTRNALDPVEQLLVI